MPPGDLAFTGDREPQTDPQPPAPAPSTHTYTSWFSAVHAMSNVTSRESSAFTTGGWLSHTRAASRVVCLWIRQVHYGNSPPSSLGCSLSTPSRRPNASSMVGSSRSYHNKSKRSWQNHILKTEIKTPFLLFIKHLVNPQLAPDDRADNGGHRVVPAALRAAHPLLL